MVAVALVVGSLHSATLHCAPFPWPCQRPYAPRVPPLFFLAVLAMFASLRRFSLLLLAVLFVVAAGLVFCFGCVVFSLFSLGYPVAVAVPSSSVSPVSSVSLAAPSCPLPIWFGWSCSLSVRGAAPLGGCCLGAGRSGRRLGGAALSGRVRSLASRGVLFAG